MEESESTFKEDSIDDEKVLAELTTKLNELYREAQLSQKGDYLEVKSNLIAEAFRQTGDKQFITGTFEGARHSYTLCLAYAEDDSEGVIGHAYANRSAALFKMGYFEQCLLDVDRALNSNYPDNKKNVLHERKELASIKAEQKPDLLSSLTREVEAEWRDKLCHFNNPHIPGASKKIKLECDESWGRHLVATEDIKPGEILASRKFFAMVNSEDLEAERGHVVKECCSYCLLYNPALIPCPTCVHAMYCSEECRTQAFDSYHRIECRIFTMNDIRASKIDFNDIMALRCLLVGTGQGDGLASLMEQTCGQDVVDVEANFDEFIKKLFSSEYTSLLGLCRKFEKPLSDRTKFIPRIIIALQKAGYFDSDPDRLQQEASIDPKADGINKSKSERNDESNETDKDISSKILDSVERPHESDDKKKDPDEGKKEDRPVVQEYADSSTMVGTSSKNADEQREAHIDAKDGNDDESVYEKDGDISSKVLDSVEIAHESIGQEEDPDVGKNEDRPVMQEHKDPSRIVDGKEFIKKVTRHYCELCDLYLCYDPKISQDEIVLAHCRTPFHVERCSAKNSEEQEITTQECMTETSPSETVILDTMAKKPQLDSPSKRRSKRKKNKAREKSASRSDDANEQKKLKHEAHIDAKDGNKEDGDTSSNVLESVEVADESVDEKEDPDVGKNEDIPIVVQEYEDTSRIVYESDDKKEEDLDDSEKEDRAQEYEDSSEIAGKEFIKEVMDYYCELCNLCLDYNQEMSEEEALLAHCNTPLHLERSSFKTAEGKYVNTQECVTETLLPKTAEEPPSESASQPPESTTEISTLPLGSLPASSDANEQNLEEREGLVLVKETSLFKLYGADVAKPEPGTATPPDDAYSVDSNANQHIKQRMTAMEIYASLLLLNHELSLDNATFALRKGDLFSKDVTVYGYGVCIFPAMINHSCDPNVDFFPRGREMALYALKPIKQGEQIFITYTVYSFAFMSLQERQQKMSYPSSKFQFKCKCKACVNEWPTYDELLKLQPNFTVSSKTTAMKAVQKITSPLSGKTAESTSRLEIILVIGRLCEWLHNNVKGPYAISAECERLLCRAVKHFYDTSAILEMSELHKKELMLEFTAKIVKHIRIDLQHLVT